MAMPARSVENPRILPTPAISAWLLQQAAAEILREVVGRCDDAGIQLMAVKGVVTSRVLYADVSERPMTDVDVRVRPRDLGGFKKAADTAGWKSLRIARTYGNLTYDFGALSLDVETHVGPPGLCALRVDAMLDRAEQQVFSPSLGVSIPELHDHAVLLTVNVFKDKIATAQPWAIADLERIAIQPRFSREIFVERIIQSRVSTLAWIVAGWMESVRGSEPWGAIRLAIESRARVRRRYARFFQSQMAIADRTPMSLRLLARVGADSPLMQAAALTRAAAWSAEMWIRRRRR